MCKDEDKNKSDNEDKFFDMILRILGVLVCVLVAVFIVVVISMLIWTYSGMW